jgi:high frequency lysogenization protein
MKHDLREQTLAFAGTLQAGELVRQIADSGQCSRQAAEHTLESLFAVDAESTSAVFGGIRGVRLGLTIAGELGQGTSRDALTSLGYASGLMRLAKLLQRDRERQQQLLRELELIDPVRQRAESVLDPAVMAQLADTYKTLLSPLPFRIQVVGRPDILKQPEKVEWVRALLLGGLRSAFLWHQIGGRPWKLLFQRKKMIRIAGDLLAGNG